MTDDARLVVMEITRLEAAHLAGLIRQFEELLSSSVGEGEPIDDPAVARLVPDAYRHDADAAREFRSLTEGDLLARRAADAGLVLDSLGPQSDTSALDDSDAMRTLTIPLRPDEVRAWLRTLAAVRLVLATRLGIVDEDPHEPDDPRFGIYDWLGFRLDGLVHAATGDD